MAMKMANMQMTKADRKRMRAGYPVGADTLDYPWGLSINLDESAIKKLGITELPDVGEELMVHACAKVVRVSASASDKVTNRAIELQITDLMLTQEMKEDMEEKEKAIKRGYERANNRRVSK